MQARGYHRLPDEDRGMLRYAIPAPFPPIRLPDGFRLQSLQEDNDLRKIDRVLWRGFNHPGEPPAGGEADRRKMQSVPRFRKDLNIVAVAPGGQFAAYAGLWFDPTNRLAYVEPVATDPDYRRLGLGKRRRAGGHPPLRRAGGRQRLCGQRPANLPQHRLYPHLHHLLLGEGFLAASAFPPFLQNGGSKKSIKTTITS